MLRPIIRVAWLCVFALLAPVVAYSQTTAVVNPTMVQFLPSADDSAVTSDGLPVVVRYDLQIYLQGATTPYVTVNLGKPTIDTDGNIRVDFSKLMSGYPLPDGSYDARVVAVGQSGVGQSDLSNQFSFQSSAPGTTPAPSCTYTLSATQGAIGPPGGTVVLNVGANVSTCGWTAMGTSSWVAMSPESGTGPGTVTLTVAANAGATRTAVLTIAGQTYTLTQAALSCTYSLAATSWAAGAAGGAGSIAVTAGDSTCGWTAASDAAWVTVSPASASGSGSVTITAAPNAGAARTATLTVAGQALAVTQAGVSCTYSLSAASWDAAPAGGTGAVTVSPSGTTCGWSATSLASWISVAPAAGTGPGSVAVTVSPNAGGARSAAVTIADKSYTVSQSAASCGYTLSATSLSAVAAGTTAPVNVSTTGTSCTWTAASSAAWATVSPAGGTGNGGVTVTVSANTGASRTATLTIGGQAYAVTQAAASCSYGVSPVSAAVAAAGQSSTLSVSPSAASCAWTAASVVDWLAVAPTSGTGSGTVSFTAAQNSTGKKRTGLITVGGVTVTVTQDSVLRPSQVTGVKVGRVKKGGQVIKK